MSFRIRRRREESKDVALFKRQNFRFLVAPLLGMTGVGKADPE